MRRTGAILLACLPILAFTACAYHNVIFNARELFEAGEEQRSAGLDSLSAVQYREVVRKTGEAYRARPDSDWACDALILLGRAHHRLGDLRAASAAFEEAGAVGPDCAERGDLQVHQAAVTVELGDRAGALERLNAALQTDLPDEAAAEAHLIRGRILLERTLMEHGWWDLDRAADIDPGVRTAAGLAALRWSLAHGDRERSRRALERLFAHRGAGARADSVMTLVSRARSEWGPAGAAQLLAGVRDASWDRSARGGLVLYRAELLHEAGDRAQARREASAVAAGLGTIAADARLLLARWRLARALNLQQLAEVRSVLLPSGADPRVAATLAAIEQVDAYANAGLEDPIGLFAAGEVARDRLGADLVARGLMLAYADGDHDEPWKPKALLAAIELSQAVGDREWLRGRLEAYGDNPYVLAARGGTAAGFETLEGELEVRLEELARQ